MRGSWKDHYNDCAEIVGRWSREEIVRWLAKNADPRLRGVLGDPADRAAYVMAKKRAGG